uniref:Uncharacterized protein n=1 Tax=Daphnia galeata TaxID=27404 RepID=A0A8J2S4X3_9CRUS|nr:unnamed protein product [Daphnia galeata]
MKSFVFLLFIVTIVCISVIHSSPVSLTRNNHRVDEPLGFLTNFILNKRSRIVQNNRPAVASVGTEGKKRAIENRVSSLPARYGNTYRKGPTGTLNNNLRNLPHNQKSVGNSVKTDISNEAAKSSTATQFSIDRIIDDLSNRDERTAEATPAEVTPEEVSPVDVAEVPVVEVIEIVPVQVVDEVFSVIETAPAVASADASAVSTDGSTVSVATSAVSETVVQEIPVKTVEVPITTPKKVVYVNKNPDYRVTLQVIHVEFDLIDPEPAHLETVSAVVTPVEITQTAAVEASAVASSTSSTDASSSVVPVGIEQTVEVVEASAGASSTSSTDGSSSIVPVEIAQSVAVEALAGALSTSSTDGSSAVAEVVAAVTDDAVTPTGSSSVISSPVEEAPATINVGLSVVGLIPVSSLSLDSAPYGLKIPLLTNSASNPEVLAITSESYNTGAEADAGTAGLEVAGGSGGAEAEGEGKGNHSWGAGGFSDSSED